MSRWDESVRFRLEELEAVMDAISKVRPELADKVRRGEPVTGKELLEQFHNLMSLYSVVGGSAAHYVQALGVVLRRRGNVERLSSSVDRRRSKRQKVA